MKILNTLTELIKASKNKPTAQQVAGSRILTVDGWQDVEINNDLKIKIFEELAEKIKGRTDKKEKIFNSLMFRKPDHNYLKRFEILETEKGLFLDYTVGQHRPTEMRKLRDYLIKL